MTKQTTVPEEIISIVNQTIKQTDVNLYEIAERVWIIAQQKGYFHSSMLQQVVKNFGITIPDEDSKPKFESQSQSQNSNFSLRLVEVNETKKKNKRRTK